MKTDDAALQMTCAAISAGAFQGMDISGYSTVEPNFVVSFYKGLIRLLDLEVAHPEQRDAADLLARQAIGLGLHPTVVRGFRWAYTNPTAPIEKPLIEWTEDDFGTLRNVGPTWARKSVQLIAASRRKVSDESS